MRLIDADYLSKELRESTALLNGNTLVPVNLLLTLIEKMPTAYDVGNVIEQIQKVHLPSASQKVRIIGYIKAGGID